MSTAQRPGGPYRQRLNDDPPPPPRGTRGWLVASGTLLAAALAMTPRLVPAAVDRPVDMRPVGVSFLVRRYSFDEVEPLRDAAAFEASREGLLVVRANGEALRLNGPHEREREVAERTAVARAWDSELTSVQGVRFLDYGSDPCLLIDERTEECTPGLRAPLRRQRAADSRGEEITRAVCRLDRGLVLCRGGLASGRVLRRARPAPVAGDVRFVALGATGQTTCGVTRAWDVRCWGPSQRAVANLPDARSLALRPELGCALREGGAVSCWPMEGAPVAAPVDLPPAVALAANATATCALDAGGVVRCWGAFGRAWPGHPRAYRARRPLDVGLSEAAVSLHPTQGEAMCARLRSGVLRCWGGPANAWSDDRPTERLGDTEADETWAAGDDALLADLRLLDDGRVLTKDIAAFRGWSVLGDVPRARALATGSSHACALATDGRAWCWGDNEAGQLGLDDAIPEDAWTAVQVTRAAAGRGARPRPLRES